MKMWAAIVLFFVCATAESQSCAHLPEISILHGSRTCCGYPLKSAIDYLTGTTPVDGACSMYSATNRFDRFREWINSIGGSVSDKVVFRRGYYVDPASHQLMFSVGGLFLNMNEVLPQGEAIFWIPHQAIFHDRMILEHIPSLPRFRYMGSPKLWFSIGLAALLKHRVDIVGPWAALLPDMSYQPQLWSAADLDHLVGTPAFDSVSIVSQYISNGCEAYSQFLTRLDLTCRNVAIANAIISSRSFGMEVFPGDEPTAIPFGPDFLNHNPNTHSWINAVRIEQATYALFYLQSYTLSPTRELFNNYGPHSLTSNMVLYGFTSPDMYDELVVVATTNDFFNGKRFPHTRGVCPAKIDLYSTTGAAECSVAWPAELKHWDASGNFRLVDRDVIALTPSKTFECRNQIGGPLWTHITNELSRNNVHVNGQEYVLRLNVVDGAEPQMNHPTLAWMALCRLPAVVPEPIVAQFVTDLTTCNPERNKRYLEEFPVNPLVKNLAKESLHLGCSTHEQLVIGNLEFNMFHWLAYRNAKRLFINKYDDIWYQDLSDRIPFNTIQAFLELVTVIISSNDVVYGDNGGKLNQLTDTFANLSLTQVDRMEEAYKYRMQLGYMLIRKCVQPLARIVKSPIFETLVSGLEEA